MRLARESEMDDDKLLDLLLRIYECPDVMFTVASNDEGLAKEIEKIIEENFE